MKLTIEIYTDGACSGNPGPGGWGVFMSCGNLSKELSGGVTHTTNQQMELQAAIEALKALKQPNSKATIYSDSKYVINGITEWISDWKKRGWKTASKKTVSNLDQWKELDTLNAAHAIDWQWVKGHAGNEGNEKADTLASNEAQIQKEQLNQDDSTTVNIISIIMPDKTHFLSKNGEAFLCQCGEQSFAMNRPDIFSCVSCANTYGLQAT